MIVSIRVRALAAQRFALLAGGRDADSAGEQKKLEARIMLENGDESHLSSARFVRRKARMHCQCPVLDSILFFIAFKVSCVSRAIFLFMMKFSNHTINFELE